MTPDVLRSYALLADGERGALVGPDGDIAWLCVPAWDSGSVFGGLIGAGGTYVITPDARYVWGGYYEDDSLVWRSRWRTTGGTVECLEALAYPGDPGRLVLLRRLVAAERDAAVRVVLEPRAEYGAHGLRAAHRDDAGVWHGRVGSLWLRWSGGACAELRDGRLECELTVPRGGCHDFVLELGTDEAPGEPADADTCWTATRAAWQRAIPELGGAAPRDAKHAVAVLRGLTSSSGGMVAAATAALPERFEAGENYDYRYVWIRDQCYAGQAAAAAGVDELVDAAVAFMGARLRADGAALAPAYTTSGGPVPGERALDVPGYPGGGRSVGNRGGAQFQLDAFGECLLLFAAAARRGRLDAEGWHAAQLAADAIATRWTEHDAGIWELEYRMWTHSRLVCAAGLRAIAAAAENHGHVGEWLALAETILADTARHGTHPSGRWQRAADDQRLDGALLLAGVRGALPVGDPRNRRTRRAYLEELTAEGYAYRYRHDDRALGAAEGAFLLCNFFLALACHYDGESLQAQHFFERARCACGPPGLFSEEFDVGERQLRGNLPQAFVHALLLESSMTLPALERRA